MKGILCEKGKNKGVGSLFKTTHLRARNLLLMGLLYLAASLWGSMVCPVAGAFHTWEIGSRDLRGRHAERRVHLQRHQGFDVPGRAYDIDPNAAREFQGGGKHEAFRSRVHEKKGHDPLKISTGASWTPDQLVRFAGDSLASEEPMPSPREVVLAYQLLNFSDLSWP